MKRLLPVAIGIMGVVIGVIIANISIVVRLGNSRSRAFSSYAADPNWRKLDVIMETIDCKYVDTLDYEKVSVAAIEGALQALDPHSVYLPPQVREDSEEDLAANFEGIGIQFNVPNDTAIVLEVIPGGPSEKAGMLKGDRILKVDDKVIAGVRYPQDSMVRRMKGPAGSKVTVTVQRSGDVIPFDITRGRIPLHSVDAAFMVNDTTGYIRLAKFARTTAAEVAQKSLDLLAKGMRTLILDLRDNSGGYLDQAEELANLFLDKGDLIVYTEGRNSPRQSAVADGRGLLRGTGLTVLINEGSASSSEIFAGAIQDNDRGVIVGRRSFGKGLVQEPIDFTDGSGIRITVARFYTPSGRCIQKPYSDDYEYDIINRYNSGELLDADSIKVDRSEVYHTSGGREVYGGGGIVPDVFVPIDTTRAGKFYIDCNRKATPMRFASFYFDRHRDIAGIDDYGVLLDYLDHAGLESGFLEFARTKDGISPKTGEWSADRDYMMTQVRALVGRYSKLGDDAFYHLYLQIDDAVKVAIGR